jgi:heterodisulfide reductase subunit C
LKDLDVNIQGEKRGPLTFIILAATGQDVRQCASCLSCEDLRVPGMDLSFGDVIRAAARDDPIALTNDTLWNCDEALIRQPICQSGLDIYAVIQTLRFEAKERGLASG